MSDPRRRLYEPKENPPPIIVNREPELYNLFSPSRTRTRRVIITENYISSRRRQRIERSPSPPPPPRIPSSRVLNPCQQRTHRHSTIAAAMPPPFVPLPPRISPDNQNPRAANNAPQRPGSAETVRPVIEERSPDRRPRVYAHPYEVREQVVESPPPENRQSVNYEVNQPVRSRPPQAAEAQELARVRAESHHREQQLDEAQRTIEILRHQLAQAARETEQQRRRATEIERSLRICEDQRQLLERENRIEAGEAQLARERSADARAALEQERQQQRTLQGPDSQARVVRRPANVVQSYRPREPRTIPSTGGALRIDTRATQPRPRSNDPAQDAIRRAQADARRGESA